MDFGKVEYILSETRSSMGHPALKLKLTLIGQGDYEALKSVGLAELRRRRILRLLDEAMEQGSLLGYSDLCALLLSSLATVKRDIKLLEKRGYLLPLRGKRKNGKYGKAA
jgi:DNA-binding MarR family transcriptional regulator